MGQFIGYKRLNNKNFTFSSLDGFIRRQEVFHCWRMKDGKYNLMPVHYIEDWNFNERQSFAKKILNGIKNGGVAFGAFNENKLIGFIYLEGKPFGSSNQYIDLAEFYVSEPFRRKGIGKQLFSMGCEEAKKLGAEKLYISAHSAEESVSAYKIYGCTLAMEINPDLAEKEPCDLQMEYVLK